MENIALVIAAILGSTGIASLANSFSVWGRRTKLRNSIKQMSEDIKSMEDPSIARQAYEASLSVQSLELASLSLIRVKSGTVLLLGLFLGTSLLALGLYLFLAFTGLINYSASYLQYPLTFTLVMGAYVVWAALCQFVVFQAGLARKRNRFVAAAWNAGHVTSELILEHSSYLKFEPSKPQNTKRTIRSLFEGLRSKHKQESSSDDS